MNGRTWIVYLVVIASIGALPGFAAGAEKRSRSVLADVAPLDKPITCTETKISLGELVQKVAEDTGVSLTAAKDVADEPVAVVVKEFPARDLLEEFADLLQYRWTRRFRGAGTQRSSAGAATRDGATSPSTAEHSNTATQRRRNSSTPNAERRTPVYEISQDLAGKQREEALRQAAFAEVEKRLREELAGYLELAALSQEQIQDLLNAEERRRREMEGMTPEQRQQFLDSPAERERSRRFGIARALSSPIARSLARLLGGLSRREWETLGQGEPLVLATDPDPAERPLPAALERLFRGSRPVVREPQNPAYPSSAEAEARFRQRLRGFPDQWAAATGYRVRIELEGNRFGSLGWLHLQAEVSPVRRDGSPESLSTESHLTGTRLHISAGAVGSWRIQPSPEEMSRRRAELENDPLLGARKPFRPEQKPQTDLFGPGDGSRWWLRDLLPELARTYGVQFIADAYWRFPPALSLVTLPTGPAALFDLLDRTTGGEHGWDRRGNLIRIRSRRWFFDRPAEIPLRRIRLWKAFYEERGALPVEEIASAVSTLSDLQIESLTFTLPQAGLPQGFGIDSPSSRCAVLLYAALVPAQQRALRQGIPLPVTRMTPLQRNLFLAAVKERYPDRPPTPEDLLTGTLSLAATELVVVRQPGEGAMRYRLERAENPATAPARTIRHPVTLLELKLRCRSAPEASFSFTVASAPKGHDGPGTTAPVPRP